MISFSPQNLRALAQRYPFCGLCAALSIVFIISAVALWRYQLSLTKLHRQRQSEGEAVLATLISSPQLRHELSLAKEIVRRIEENLASEDNLDESLTYFYGIEGKATAKLEDLHPLTGTPTDAMSLYKRVPFALKLSGGYPELSAFLKAIETGSKPASITYFSVRRRSPNSTQLVLDINVEFLGRNRP